MAEIKKKNFWHYKEIPQDKEVQELMPDFKLEYVIRGDNVPGNNTCVWNHSIFPPGASHYKHMHTNADEVAYVVSGRCVAGVTVDGEDIEIVCGPGTAIWAARGQAHWHDNIFDEPCEFVGAYFGVSSLEDSGYVDLRPEEEKEADQN